MTTSTFQYINPTSFTRSTTPFIKPWAKVDGPGYSFNLSPHSRTVNNLRTHADPKSFTVDTSGFQLLESPATEKAFTDENIIRDSYYPEIIKLLTDLPQASKVKKVVIFDHTIRRNKPDSARQPVQQVHVDQTPAAAEARVRRHVPAEEADELVQGRYQIINVWRPISHAATDFPLAVVDWRTTRPEDFVHVDLLYPSRDWTKDDDDRGKEVLPDANSKDSHQGYEIKGETFAVLPEDRHGFWYVRDMRPEECLLLKCFDSRGQWMGDNAYDPASSSAATGEKEKKEPNGVVNGVNHAKEAWKGVANCAPHTAFIDPLTPADAKPRESIEVRCLVFYE